MQGLEKVWWNGTKTLKANQMDQHRVLTAKRDRKRWLVLRVMNQGHWTFLHRFRVKGVLNRMVKYRTRPARIRNSLKKNGSARLQSFVTLRLGPG